MLKKLKNILVILAVTTGFIFAADFILTACKLDPISRIKALKSISGGTSHPVYHHDLKPNLDIETMWGPVQYRLCTNEFGFKVSCDPQKRTSGKSFDIAFIGDSFAEATGMSYENSFVGMYAAKHPELSVVNLGVSSYSPSIYLKKIEYLLDKGFYFKHIVVLPDISDIQDEAILYIIDRDKGIVVQKEKTIEATYERPQAEANQAPKKKDRNIWEQHFRFIWYANLEIYAWLHNPKARIQGRDYIYDRAQWTTDQSVSGFGKDGVAGGIKQAMESMHELKVLLDKRNIKMSLAVYPWPSQLANDAPGHPGSAIWKDFCAREHCANFIDANNFFFEQLKRSNLDDVVAKYYIKGDLHFNQEGNKSLFEIIDRNLKP